MAGIGSVVALLLCEVGPGGGQWAALKKGWCKRAKKELVCGMTHSTKGINSEGHTQETLLAERVGKRGGSNASILVGTLGAGEFVALFFKVDLKQVLFGVRSDLILSNTGSGGDINGKGGGLNGGLVSEGRWPVDRRAKN